MNDSNSSVGYNLYNLEPQFRSYLSAGKGISPHSVKNYLSDFRYFAGWAQSYPASPSDSGENNHATSSLLSVKLLSDYRNYLIGCHLPYRTINRRLSTVRRFCSFSISQGWLKENFGKNIHNVLPDNGNNLSESEITTFVAGLKEPGKNQSDANTVIKDVAEFIILGSIKS